MGGGGNNALSISVLADQSGTKGLIESGYLPDKSKIGVSVTNSTGGAYDGTTYHNIPYTASGTGASQSWSGSTIPLSMNQGACYAYYPYSSEVSDITAVPVSTSGQVDYMYATPVTVNAEAKNATLNMNHALSAVRFLLKRGSYAGTGTVTAVSVTSAGVGTSGSLNIKNGDVTGVTGTGTAIGVDADITLSELEQTVDVIVVPTETAADLTLSVTLDGVAYSTVISSATIVQSKCHKYTLTVNQGELALSSVKVGDWGYDESGAPTITAGGYTVTFAGDFSNFAFINSVSDGTVIIQAYNVESSSMIRPVTISSGATLEQTGNDNQRTVILTNINSNITVTFTGTVLTWPEDGVYVVQSDGTPVDTMYATYNCIGVALSNNATNQKLMIEKNEYKNSSYLTAASGKSSTRYFYWGENEEDQSIPNLKSTNDAKADYNGKENSEVLKSVTIGGDSYTSYATIGAVLNQFISTSSDNKGFKDWYIPSSGQFYLIYQNISAINNTLSSIDGVLFTSGNYWSSSERGLSSIFTDNNAYIGQGQAAWCMDLKNGVVFYTAKSFTRSLRLVRDMN